MIRLSYEVRSMISIWFFIGISLAVNGALILAAGIYQVVNPPLNPDVSCSTCTPTCGGAPCFC